MYVPETVEDEEELNEDAAKWQYTSHEGGRDRMRQPALVRNLTGDLVCSYRLLRCLLRKGGGGRGGREIESEGGGGGRTYCNLEGEERQYKIIIVYIEWHTILDAQL